MKKSLLLMIACLFCCSGVFAQVDTEEDSLDRVNAVVEIHEFQQELNDEFKDTEGSPLSARDRKKFEGHDFFPIDLRYRVRAKLVVEDNSSFFSMKTTTSRLPNYRIYGYLEFTLMGKDFRLPVYQSEDLMGSDTYANYLFFPFSDLTNGTETYGGGRFIDLMIPEAGVSAIVLDFNMAYNPYCAYNHKYSCPLVPEENQMDIEVPVGVRYTDRH